MKIYTKTGDAGTTSLIGGERVAKDDPRVEAYGTVDELSAQLAYLRDNMDVAETGLEEYRDDIRVILNTLMTVEALLATGKEYSKKVEDLRISDLAYLEDRIDYISGQLEPVTHFTIPGGHPLVSLTHICRTVCRRAERCAIAATRFTDTCSNTLGYLNRLSDYLYVLGRRLCNELSVDEEYWEAPKAGKTEQ